MIWLVRGTIAFILGTAAAAALYAPQVFTVRSTLLLGLFLVLGIGLNNYLRRHHDMARQN